jgi:hypothetical protein
MPGDAESVWARKKEMGIDSVILFTATVETPDRRDSMVTQGVYMDESTLVTAVYVAGFVER